MSIEPNDFYAEGALLAYRYVLAEILSLMPPGEAEQIIERVQEHLQSQDFLTALGNPSRQDFYRAKLRAVVEVQYLQRSIHQ